MYPEGWKDFFAAAAGAASALAGLVFVALSINLTRILAIPGLPARGRQFQSRRQFLLRVILHQAATLPFILASASLLGAFGGGPHWLALGIILALVVGLQNACVLLVEILR